MAENLFVIGYTDEENDKGKEVWLKPSVEGKYIEYVNFGTLENGYSLIVFFDEDTNNIIDAAIAGNIGLNF